MRASSQWVTFHICFRYPEADQSWCKGPTECLFCLLLHTCLAAWITKDKERTNEHIIIIIYPLTMRVGGAPRMISQPVSSIFPCSHLPSGTWRTPGLSTSWCCLPISSSVCLVYFPLSLCLARQFWPDMMNGRHDHTTAVHISLRWPGGLHVVQLLAGSWHGLPHR